MQNIRTTVAFALAVGLAGPAMAQAVRPIQDQAIDLGHVGGDIYYTVKPDGYHVVATLAEPGDGVTPVRFETVLAPGQTVRLSTPRGAGEPPNSVEITRQANRVVLRKVDVVD